MEDNDYFESYDDPISDTSWSFSDRDDDESDDD